MTARVSMLLKSRASLTCFRACFLPGRAKDLSAPRWLVVVVVVEAAEQVVVVVVVVVVATAAVVVVAD